MQSQSLSPNMPSTKGKHGLNSRETTSSTLKGLASDTINAHRRHGILVGRPEDSDIMSTKLLTNDTINETPMPRHPGGTPWEHKHHVHKIADLYSRKSWCRKTKKLENYFRLKENKETGHLNAMQDLRQPLDQENVPKDFTGTTSKTWMRSADCGIADNHYGINVNFPDFENCT